MNGKIRLVALLTALLMLFQTIALAEVVTTVDDYNTLLQSRIEQFVNGTPEVQYAILMALATDEQRESMLALLSEDQCIALDKYVIALDPPVYKTVNFTHAGPFMPPVDVSGIARMRLMRTAAYSNDNTAVDNESVYTSKVVSGNAKDGYKLRLETYVTGQTIVDKVEKSIPVDIVLVLDQSGSMAYDFSGNETNTNTDRRQYAMKNAVNGFISSVAEKYNPDESDHRIAIVTFASNASSLQGWTYVDADGSNTLHGKINKLTDSPEGATNVAAGMSQASTLLGSGYSYTGQNTQRQKVVIVFTDGVPTTDREFNTDVADNAIKTAKSLKDEDVTVYSLGIFNGADPKQLHGEKWVYTVYDDVLCDGSVGSYWGGSWLSSIVGSNDFAPIDIAAGNRFLNYLSSNTPRATKVGLERGWFNPSGKGGGRGKGYKITENFNKENSNYYLTAGNAESLDEMFQRISNNIQTGQASIALSTETVVKDIVADSFQLPENAATNGIKVYTSNYNADKTWSADNEVNLKVNVVGSTVSVTGFDFAKNYVNLDAQNGRDENDPSKPGTFYGRKLIIEIPIQVCEGFLGGNNVPTNGAGSGVYASSDAATPIETFTSPTVNVPIAPITVTAPDKNVYLLGGLTQDQMKYGATITSGTVSIDPTRADFGLQDWQRAYVNIDITTSAELSNLTADASFTVGCAITPKTDGAGAVGTAASGQSKSDEGTVNVFKPVMTFADSVVEYLSTHTFDEYFTTNNYQGVVWKHEDTQSTDSGFTMTGNAPTLDLTYAYNTDSETNIEKVDTVENGVVGKIIATSDIPVDVAVKIGAIDVTSHVTFGHDACGQDIQCGWDNNTTSKKFLLHVINIVADLTITKTGLDVYAYADDVDQEMAIFTVTVETKDGPAVYTIALANGQSATIKDVLVGKDYTITEQNGWTWRYENKNPITDTMAVGGKSETIKNVADNPYWLGGDNYAVNVFGTTTTGDAGTN